MNKGNLHDLVKSETEVITSSHMMLMAAQIASGNVFGYLTTVGMLYLSSEHIVHRDLALRSIHL